MTSSLIGTLAPLCLRELLGDLAIEKTKDTKKKHTKESKARKAGPLMESFA